jgi:hypothetical protein
MLDLGLLNPLTPELIHSRNADCQNVLLEILIFEGLIARRLYKSFGVKGLRMGFCFCAENSVESKLQGFSAYHILVPIVLKSGSLSLLEHSGPVQVCNGIALPLSFYG